MLNARKKIALVNHQPLMLEALIRIFGAAEAFLLTDATSPLRENIKDALSRDPHLILLDCGNSADRLVAITDICKLRPDIKVLVFSSEISPGFVAKALEAGAAGYVSTTSTTAELMHAAQTVTSGEIFISPQIGIKLITSLRAATLRKASMQEQRLNVREEQIASLLLKGKTNRQIAQTLGLSEKTIKHYMHHLMQKLHAKNRLELALSMRTAPAIERRFVD
jgi:two-component system nitrate/nitrite response regulator NarL